MKRCLLAVICLLLSSPAWANPHKRYYANVHEPFSLDFAHKHRDIPKSDLVISAELNKDRSSTYFAYVDIILQNKSEDWMDLQNMQLYFSDPEAQGSINIVVGPQLALWNDADTIRREEEAKKAAITAALVGSVIAVGAQRQNNQVVANIGVLTAGAGMFEFASGGYKLTDKEKKLVDELPDTHALRGPYILPPGLIRSKWVLFNSRQHAKIGFQDVMTLEFDLIKGAAPPAHKKLHVRLRAKDEGDWQDDLEKRIGKNKYYPN